MRHADIEVGQVVMICRYTTGWLGMSPGVWFGGVGIVSCVQHNFGHGVRVLAGERDIVIPGNNNPVEWFYPRDLKLLEPAL